MSLRQTHTSNRDLESKDEIKAVGVLYTHRPGTSKERRLLLSKPIKQNSCDLNRLAKALYLNDKTHFTVLSIEPKLAGGDRAIRELVQEIYIDSSQLTDPSFKEYKKVAVIAAENIAYQGHIFNIIKSELGEVEEEKLPDEQPLLESRQVYNNTVRERAAAHKRGEDVSALNVKVLLADKKSQHLLCQYKIDVAMQLLDNLKHQFSPKHKAFVRVIQQEGSATKAIAAEFKAALLRKQIVIYRCELGIDAFKLFDDKRRAAIQADILSPGLKKSSAVRKSF